MAKPTGPRAIFISGGLLWAASQGVQAETSLSIRAVIVAPPPCVINGGSTLDVPFGNDLLTSRVDGVNYRRDVPYTVTCNSPFSNALTLELKGTAAAVPVNGSFLTQLTNSVGGDDVTFSLVARAGVLPAAGPITGSGVLVMGVP